jgi:hypothetical protein
MSEFICLHSVLTPQSRVLPEKLTGPQLVKKFPAFYGTRISQDYRGEQNKDKLVRLIRKNAKVEKSTHTHTNKHAHTLLFRNLKEDITFILSLKWKGLIKIA